MVTILKRTVTFEKGDNGVTSVLLCYTLSDGNEIRLYGDNSDDKRSAEEVLSHLKEVMETRLLEYMEDDGKETINTEKQIIELSQVLTELKAEMSDIRLKLSILEEQTKMLNSYKPFTPSAPYNPDINPYRPWWEIYYGDAPKWWDDRWKITCSTDDQTSNNKKW